MHAFSYIILSPLLSFILGILRIYEIILIVRVLISWVNPDPYNPVVRILYAVTEPLISYIRRTIPLRVGMFDLSVIFAFLFIEILRRVIQYIYFTIR